MMASKLQKTHTHKTPGSIETVRLGTSDSVVTAKKIQSDWAVIVSVAKARKVSVTNSHHMLECYASIHLYPPSDACFSAKTFSVRG